MVVWGSLWLGSMVSMVMALTNEHPLVTVLLTMMTKMKIKSPFLLGSLQNLSPPRRSSHPYAPETIPPTGCPGSPGMLGPNLHHPSIWLTTQGPQWQGNILGTLGPLRTIASFAWRRQTEFLSQGGHSEPGNPKMPAELRGSCGIFVRSNPRRSGRLESVWGSGKVG